MWRSRPAAKLRAGGAAALAALVWLGLPGSAGGLSVAGSLDPSFGSGGAVLEQLGQGSSPSSLPSAVLTQPDGGLVIVGEATTAGGPHQLLATRLGATGNVDLSFGSGGTAGYQFGAGSPAETLPQDAALAGDGKILVSGRSSDGAGGFEAFAARLNPDGTLDTSFAAGGVFLRQLGQGGAPASEARTIAVQSDGNILLAGDATDAGGHSQLAVARLTTTGVLDPTFHTTGIFSAQLGKSPAPSSAVNRMAVQRDGRIVLAGSASDADGHAGVLVTRLTSGGTFDPAFGAYRAQLGQLASSADAVALQNDGRIVVGCGVGDDASSQRITVLRLTPGGGLDSRFALPVGFSQPLASPSHLVSQHATLAVTADDSIVVGGDTNDAAGNPEILLVRLNSAGARATEFGQGGATSVQLGVGSNAASTVDALAIQADGRIVAATSTTDDQGNRQLGVARFLGARNAAPIPMFTMSPAAPQAGRFTAFDARGSRASNGHIVSYRWSFGDGADSAEVTPFVAHAYAAPGTYTVTMSAIDNYNFTGTTTKTVSVQPSSLVVTRQLRIEQVHESARRWREGLRQTTTGRSNSPVGTSFSFVLDLPATVRLAFDRFTPGRRVGSRCLPQTTRARKTRFCTIIVPAGELRVASQVGTNRVRFAGRLASGRLLRAGLYRVVATATDASGMSSSGRILTFRIVKV